jgi:riboflavin kinase/FMN adenylyltransferase
VPFAFNLMHFNSLDNLHLQNAWLAIGIFDGVHLGHRALLNRLVEGAHAAEAQAVVLTFEPHPAIVLGGKKDFKCLTTPAERIALLQALGVDVVITQRFDRAFADQTASEFMHLVQGSLDLHHLVLGYDTALGRDREGNVTRLTELGEEMEYTVEIVEPVRKGESVISSSAIRDLIREGAVRQASRLLAGFYTLSGQVIHGDGRGRHINIPTANIEPPEGKLIPADGIYATWTRVGGERFRGATNIGTNPTFTPEKQSASIDTHLLDLDRDLYGQEVKLEFVTRLREELKFASVEALLEQIRIDINRTRLVLK